MIRLENVTKQFGSLTAVDQVSVTVQAGEIFGLVGPDGAGKTTVIRMIAGILDATAGDMSVLGATSVERIKDQIGYVPQKFSLYGELTVIENIRLIGALYGASGEQVEILAKEILGFTKLLPFKDRLADNLSGGMKQKLALAAGLLHKPKLFILDEPTTGVDPVSRREFWQMLYRLNQEGMTVLVSTPYMDEAELCTRIAFMHNGRIICCDTPKQLKADYPYKVIELQTSCRDIKKRLVHSAIRDINAFGNKYHLVVEQSDSAVTDITKALQSAGVEINDLAEIEPTLEDVFVALSQEGG